MRIQNIQRTGLSLVEVTVGVLLFAFMMGAVMQATSSVVQEGTAMSTDAGLAQDAEAIAFEVRHDLLISGWHLVDKIQTTAQLNIPDAYYPKVLQQGPTYFPNGSHFAHMARTVEMHDLDLKKPWPVTIPGELGDDTRNFNSGADPTDAVEYMHSFRARSQELVFLRAALGDWTADPAAQEYESFNFDGTSELWRSDNPDHRNNHLRLGIIEPDQWMVDFDPVTKKRRDYYENYFTYTDDVNGVPTITPRVRADRSLTATFLARVPVAEVRGAYASPGGQSGLSIQTRWETAQPWDDVVLVQDAYADVAIRPDQLREFCYAVVPTDFGVGRLVRAYSTIIGPNDPVTLGNRVGDAISSGTVTLEFKNANGGDEDETVTKAMIIDKVLSDDVARVVFDTYSTDDSLGVNEVRMRLYMARETIRESMQIHKADYTFVMGTRDNDVRNAQIEGLFTARDDDERRFIY